MEKTRIITGFFLVLLMCIFVSYADETTLQEPAPKENQSVVTGGGTNMLATVCVSEDRYGQGTKLYWYKEGDASCYLCTRTGTCSDRCYKYHEICYNLIEPLWGLFN